MKKIITILIILIVTNAKAQINLSIAESYIKGDTITLYQHLIEKGYTYTNDTIWSSSSGIDSVYEYTHKLGFDKINVVKNTGFIIRPTETDSIDYYSDYIKQLLVYLTNEGEQVKTTEAHENGAMKLTTNYGIVYIIDPREGLIMIY